jgi:hypothetical protein
MVVRGAAWAGGDLHVAEADAGAATSFERRRPAPLPVGAVFDDRPTGGGIVAFVRRGQPADALAAHVKAVSFMPSGSQIRSRRASPKDMPVARAMSTPVTSAALDATGVLLCGSARL